MDKSTPPAGALSAAFFDHVRKALFGGKLAQTQVDGLNILAAAWLKDGDGDANKFAYVLGTVFHETAKTMQPIFERGGPNYFDKYEYDTKLGKQLGNLQPGDGFRYRGRGYIQLTGRGLYASVSRRMGLPTLPLKPPIEALVGNPDDALHPDLAADIAVRGMMSGWFTSKKLGDYIHGSTVGFVNARRVVNGTDQANLIAQYANAFRTALGVAK